jgi:hypothetical protein
MLNILEIICGLFVVGMIIYVLFKGIILFKEQIEMMIKDRRLVDNKFYYVMAFVSLILPFVLLFKFGINSKTKCLCVMAFPSCIFFWIRSLGFKINFFDVFKGKVRDEDKIGLSSEVLEKIEAIEEKGKRKAKKNKNRKK